MEMPGLESKMNPKVDHGEETYVGHERLDGCAAVITGGDSGIGRAVAIAFAREGCDVLINFLDSEEADARETARWVEKAGRRCILLPGDITREDTCLEIGRRAFDEFGKVDILVNNAAYQSVHVEKDLTKWSTEDFDLAFKTNVYAMFWLCKEIVPKMKAGASVINVSSVQGYSPDPSLLAYASTKSAILNFTKALAKLSAHQGIRVNAIAPGPVWTPMIPASWTEERVKTFGKHTLFHRPAQPSEIAPAFVFLASNDANYISGECLPITGGKTHV